MTKSFERLYSDGQLRKRVSSLAWRYYSAYRYQFHILGMDKEDIEQELWLKLWKSGDYKRRNIITRMVSDVYDMLESSTRKKRAHEYADSESMAFIDENGDLETDDEVMSRLVYHGKGRYI